MIDKEKYKEGFKREIEALCALREEVRLQVSLAKADIKSEFDRLETRFDLAQEEFKRVQGHSKAAMHDLEENLQSLAEELKRGYEAIRRTLQA